MARRFNCRRVKIHRTYTIAELAALIGAHKHTISRWIAAGLPTTDSTRPLPYPGAMSFALSCGRANPSNSVASQARLYCFGCRAPKRPAGNMADYIPRTATRGLLSGICPACGKMIYRATSLAKIEQIGGELDIAFPKAEQRLDDTSAPLSNVDFKQDHET